MDRPDDEARLFRRRAAETFDGAAPFYGFIDLFSKRVMGRVTGEMSRIVPLGSGTRILEVFCATGLFSRILARTGAEVFSVDISRRMIGRASRAGGGLGTGYLVADAAHLPFPDASFDLVVAARGLHGMPRRVRDRVVSEIGRVSGGWALFMEPARPSNALEWVVMEILERLEGGYEQYREFIRMDFPRYLSARGFSPRRLVPDRNEQIILCRKGGA
jgi:ubiquinone/menaquinone biosynthesis C-methylase UbiE